MLRGSTAAVLAIASLAGPASPPGPLPAAPAAEGPRRAPPPAGEVRALWVARWDFRTEADVRAIVARAALLGFNRVVFQVRGQANAYYRSDLEPWGEELEGPPELGGDPGFDPLATAIDEARRRGISLHAWANLLPGWKGARLPMSRRHVARARPEWFLVDQAGRRKICDRAKYALLNPCLPAVRAHIVRVIADIAARYPIAGLQIDYVRFLDRQPSRGEDVPYDPVTLKLFRARSGGRPADHPEAWDRFRRQAIDSLVEGVARAAREHRPGILISLAAIRDAAHARSHLFQDAEGWKRAGLIDEVFPMDYEADLGRFREWARSWVRSCGGDSTVVGIGAHLLAEPADLLDQVRALRSAPPGERPAGYALFAYGELFTSPATDERDAASVARRSRLRALVLSLNRPAPVEASSIRPGG